MPSDFLEKTLEQMIMDDISLAKQRGLNCFYQNTVRRHLENVSRVREKDWRPCMHDQCTQCHGTRVKWDGSACIHMISCPCPKCSPSYM